MGFLSKLLNVQKVPTTDRRSLVGVFDFSYQHYALGDLLTTQVDLAVMAAEQQIDNVDILVMVNPQRPSARFQPFVTPDNYTSYLDNILPALTCNPMLRSLQVFRDIYTFNYALLSRYGRGDAILPDLDNHLRMRQNYPIGHQRINAFHARTGRIPSLPAPRSYEKWAERFHRDELAGRPLVIINPRQSSLTNNPTVVYRDAPLDSWHAFIDEIAAKDPEILFVMVGGFQEWEHRLQHRKNVFIPRAFGLTLAHELGLIRIAELFMGTSSGFATFATFSEMNYAILNIEHSFAPHVGLEVGDRHYPFGRKCQILTWHRETTDELLALFNELYEKRSDRRAGSPSIPAIQSSRL
jgi:hypothetical protein